MGEKGQQRGGNGAQGAFCHISGLLKKNATQPLYSAWRDKYNLLSKVYFIFKVIQHLIYSFIDMFSMSKHTIIIG